MFQFFWDNGITEVGFNIKEIKGFNSSCQYFGVCGGGATSNKYWENGTMRSSETIACKYYQKNITYVILEKLEGKVVNSFI